MNTQRVDTRSAAARRQARPIFPTGGGTSNKHRSITPNAVERSNVNGLKPLLRRPPRRAYFLRGRHVAASLEMWPVPAIPVDASHSSLPGGSARACSVKLGRNICACDAVIWPPRHHCYQLSMTARGALNHGRMLGRQPPLCLLIGKRGTSSEGRKLPSCAGSVCTCRSALCKITNSEIHLTPLILLVFSMFKQFHAEHFRFTTRSSSRTRNIAFNGGPTYRPVSTGAS